MTRLSAATIVQASRAEAPLILALDIGISSQRALLLGHWGRRVNGVETRTQVGVRNAAPGASEIESDLLLHQICGSPAWLQIMADVLGRPIVVSQVREAASARGVALLAREALSVYDDVGAAPRMSASSLIRIPDRHAIYETAITRQQQLYTSLINTPNAV